MEDRSLGAILLETSSLTEEQLEQALAVQRERGVKLGEALVQLKLLRSEDVLRALSVQLGFPYENHIDIDTIPNDLISTLPIGYAKQNEILPLRKDDHTNLFA